VRFTTNGRCAKNNTHIYVAPTSNNRVISSGDLYRCLLPRCEALRTCRSGFPIATGIGRIFSREGPFVDFPWGGKSGEISFYPLGKVENNLFCQNFDRKISNFKTQGGALPPCTPFRRPRLRHLLRCRIKDKASSLDFLQNDEGNTLFTSHCFTEVAIQQNIRNDRENECRPLLTKCFMTSLMMWRNKN